MPGLNKLKTQIDGAALEELTAETRPDVISTSPRHRSRSKTPRHRSRPKSGKQTGPATVSPCGPPALVNNNGSSLHTPCAASVFLQSKPRSANDAVNVLSMTMCCTRGAWCRTSQAIARQKCWDRALGVNQGVERPGARNFKLRFCSEGQEFA